MCPLTHHTLTQALAKGGILVIKDNCVQEEEYGACYMDKTDNSALRSDAYLKWVAQRAGLQPVSSARQQDWPEDMIELSMHSFQVATTAA